MLRLESFAVSMDEADTILQSMFDMVERLKMPAPELGEYLLPEGHQQVLDELQRRQTARHQQPHKDKQDTARVQRNQEYIEAKGISWTSLAPAADIAKSPWYQLLPQREKEIVAFYSTTVPNAIALTPRSGSTVRACPRGT